MAYPAARRRQKPTGTRMATAIIPGVDRRPLETFELEMLSEFPVVGEELGANVGSPVGEVGAKVGVPVGKPVGDVGAKVGVPVGAVGVEVGVPVGAVGAKVGTPVGTDGRSFRSSSSNFLPRDPSKRRPKHKRDAMYRRFMVRRTEGIVPFRRENERE